MTQPQTHPDAQAGPADDPLASLHKMSRTAGLGSQEYVEINPTAVVGVLLGLASGLAVLGTILLVIPVAAVIVCLVAIRQINRSAGTQSGKGMAWVGLVLAVGCVAVVGGKQVLHAAQVRSEQGQIVELIDQLGQNLGRTDYDAAWAQFSPRFQERVPRRDFENLWTQLQTSPVYGTIQSMRWNGILDVQIDRSSGRRSLAGRAHRGIFPRASPADGTGRLILPPHSLPAPRLCGERPQARMPQVRLFGGPIISMSA
jgi:hypothetical protein